MPVRSLNSSILRWPDKKAVDRAVRHMVENEIARRPEMLKFGYFGSYARGDYGVGSDLDLVAVIERTDAPFERRTLSWDLSGLPVPAELLVYSKAEYERLLLEGGRFAHVLQNEVVWVYEGGNWN